MSAPPTYFTGGVSGSGISGIDISHIQALNSTFRGHAGASKIKFSGHIKDQVLADGIVCSDFPGAVASHGQP